jgi:hypothetical protein
MFDVVIHRLASSVCFGTRAKVLGIQRPAIGLQAVFGQSA